MADSALSRHQRAVMNGDYQAVVFLLTDVFAEVSRSEASFAGPGSSATVFINGVLTLVEKGHGVYVEWNPSEKHARSSLSTSDEAANGAVNEDWVIEGSSPPRSLVDQQQQQNQSSPTHQTTASFAFSSDIKDLRSYKYEDPKKGIAWIRFICKDGQNSETLHFRGGGYRAFVDCIQRYTTLSRSNKERNLVLFVDECTEALEKSVGMLNLNKDIMSRFLSNPYATSLTALSKVTNFMAPLLDPDSATENQIKALSMLDPKNENIRSHNDEQGFEHIFELQLPERPHIVHHDSAVNEEVWNSFRDEEGRIKDVHSLKSLIFRGGIDWDLRKVLWKYMLGYYKWDKTDEENKEIRKGLSDSYYRMKLQWMSMTEDQERRFGDFRDRKALIDKDVMRTDRTHPFFNREKKEHLVTLKDILMTYMMYDFDLGYVQGMSDFLSPILVIMDDEVDSFWCFVGLMNRVHENFEMDQLAIKKQLQNIKSILEIVNPRLANYLESHDSDHMYFCFRWILVAFKREFNFDDIMHLWEVLWTDIPCSAFLILFCVAILDGQTFMIIENKFGLTEILKHINNLSSKINLNETLRIAEAVYHQLAAVQDKLPRHVCEILSFSVDEDETAAAAANGSSPSPRSR